MHANRNVFQIVYSLILITLILGWTVRVEALQDFGDIENCGIWEATLTIENDLGRSVRLDDIVLEIPVGFAYQALTSVITLPNCSITGAAADPAVAGTILTWDISGLCPNGNENKLLEGETMTITFDVAVSAAVTIGEHLIPDGLNVTYTNYTPDLKEDARYNVVQNDLDCNITAPDRACINTPGITAEVPDAGPGATYAWTLNGSPVGTDAAQITFDAPAAAGNAALAVTVTDADGCVCTATHALTVTDATSSPNVQTTTTGTAQPYFNPCSTGDENRVLLTFANNVGNGDVVDLKLRYTLAPGFAYAGNPYIFFSGTDYSVDPLIVGDELIWDLSGLPPMAEDVPLYVRFNLRPDCTVSDSEPSDFDIKYTFTVKTSTGEECYYLDESMQVDVSLPGLIVEKVPETPSVAPDGTFNWTVKITNNGFGDAVSLTVTDILGTGMQFNSVVGATFQGNPYTLPAYSSTGGGGDPLALTWDLSSLTLPGVNREPADPRRRTLEINLNVTALGCDVENWTNEPSVQSGCDGVICDDDASSFSAEMDTAEADIAMSIYRFGPAPLTHPKCGGSYIGQCDRATFQVTLVNNGDGSAFDVVFPIQNQYPYASEWFMENLRLVSSEPAGVSYTTAEWTYDQWQAGSIWPYGPDYFAPYSQYNAAYNNNIAAYGSTADGQRIVRYDVLLEEMPAGSRLVFQVDYGFVCPYGDNHEVSPQSQWWPNSYRYAYVFGRYRDSCDRPINIPYIGRPHVDNTFPSNYGHIWNTEKDQDQATIVEGGDGTYRIQFRTHPYYQAIGCDPGLTMTDALPLGLTIDHTRGITLVNLTNGNDVITLTRDGTGGDTGYTFTEYDPILYDDDGVPATPPVLTPTNSGELEIGITALAKDGHLSCGWENYELVIPVVPADPCIPGLQENTVSFDMSPCCDDPDACDGYHIADDTIPTNIECPDPGPGSPCLSVGPAGAERFIESDDPGCATGWQPVTGALEGDVLRYTVQGRVGGTPGDFCLDEILFYHEFFAGTTSTIPVLSAVATTAEIVITHADTTTDTYTVPIVCDDASIRFAGRGGDGKCYIDLGAASVAICAGDTFTIQYEARISCYAGTPGTHNSVDWLYSGFWMEQQNREDGEPGGSCNIHMDYQDMTGYAKINNGSQNHHNLNYYLETCRLGTGYIRQYERDGEATDPFPCEDRRYVRDYMFTFDYAPGFVYEGQRILCVRAEERDVGTKTVYAEPTLADMSAPGGGWHLEIDVNQALFYDAPTGGSLQDVTLYENHQFYCRPPVEPSCEWMDEGYADDQDLNGDGVTGEDVYLKLTGVDSCGLETLYHFARNFPNLRGHLEMDTYPIVQTVEERDMESWKIDVFNTGTGIAYNSWIFVEFNTDLTQFLVEKGGVDVTADVIPVTLADGRRGFFYEMGNLASPSEVNFTVTPMFEDTNGENWACDTGYGERERAMKVYTGWGCELPPMDVPLDPGNCVDRGDGQIVCDGGPNCEILMDEVDIFLRIAEIAIQKYFNPGVNPDTGSLQNQPLELCKEYPAIIQYINRKLPTVYAINIEDALPPGVTYTDGSAEVYIVTPGANPGDPPQRTLYTGSCPTEPAITDMGTHFELVWDWTDESACGETLSGGIMIEIEYDFTTSCDYQEGIGGLVVGEAEAPCGQKLYVDEPPPAPTLLDVGQAGFANLDTAVEPLRTDGCEIAAGLITFSNRTDPLVPIQTAADVLLIHVLPLGVHFLDGTASAWPINGVSSDDNPTIQCYDAAIQGIVYDNPASPYHGRTLSIFGFEEGQEVLVWDLDDMAEGKSGEASFSYQSDRNCERDERYGYTRIMYVSEYPCDTITCALQMSDDQFVLYIERTADLSITKTPDTDPVCPGENTTWALTAVNNGPLRYGYAANLYMADVYDSTRFDVVPSGTTAGYSLAADTPSAGLTTVTWTKDVVPGLTDEDGDGADDLAGGGATATVNLQLQLKEGQSLICDNSTDTAVAGWTCNSDIVALDPPGCPSQGVTGPCEVTSQAAVGMEGPDLSAVITPNISCAADELAGTVEVEVTNGGTCDADSFSVALSSGCLVFDQAKKPVTGLAAGESATVTFTIQNGWQQDCASCNCTFTAVVDADDEIYECDETNNSVDEPYKSQAPDLTVDGALSVYCPGGQADGTFILTGSVTITNTGCGPYQGDVDVDISPYPCPDCPDEAQPTAQTQTFTVDLDPGESATVNIADVTFDFVPLCDVECAPPCQGISVNLEVDPVDAICECDGENNTACVDVTPFEYPELAIESITSGVTCSNDGDFTAQAVVTVANTGCANAQNVLVNLTSACGLTFTDQTVTVPAGEQVKVAFDVNNITCDNCDDCTLTATVDPNNQICETGCEANTKVGTITFAIPDLNVALEAVEATCDIDDGWVVITGSVTVDNEGCGAGGLPATMPVGFTVFDSTGAEITALAWTENIPVGSLGQAVAFKHRFEIDLCDESGCNDITVVALADPANDICECDGTNNEARVTVPVEMPDLEVLLDTMAVTCGNDDPTLDGLVKFTGNVTVTNTGCGVTGVPATIPVDFTVLDGAGDPIVGLTWHMDMAVGDIGTPVAIDENFTIGLCDVSGCENVIVQAVVDRNGAICECDDDNNTATAAVPVEIPDIEIESDTLGVVCEEDGQYKVEGAVTLTNNGCGSNLTEDVNVRFTLYAGTDTSGTQLRQWTETFTGVDIASGGGAQEFTITDAVYTGNICEDSTDCRVMILVEADYDDRICECDGTDNTLETAPMTIEIPDIEIESDALGVVCEEDGQYKVEGAVTLTNNGCGSNLTEDVNVRFTLYAGTDTSGAQLRQWTETFTGVDIASGGGAQEFTITDAVYTGNICEDSTDCRVMILVEADYDDRICECSDTDNTRATDPIFINIPDLTVSADSDPAFQCSITDSGGSILVDGTVFAENIGCGDLEAGKTVQVRFTLYDGPGGTGNVIDTWAEAFSFPALPAGGSSAPDFTFSTHEANICDNAPNCAVSLVMEVDSEENICECEGDNNNRAFDLPCVTHEKNGPVITATGGNSHDAVYTVTVKNFGSAEGMYTLIDIPTFDDDITINRGTFVSTPGLSGALSTTNGAGNALATDQVIAAGATDVFTLTYDVTLDLSGETADPGGDDTYTACGQASTDNPGDPGQGLYNASTLDTNGDGTPEEEDEVCSDLPAIEVEKATNGVDADDTTGPILVVGETVTWTYVVTNTGGLPFEDVTVEDDIIGPVTCPGTTLGVGESMTCTMTGIVVEGQYENMATITGTPVVPPGEPPLPPIKDEDPSHYVGPGIDVEKSTNGEDADDPTGPAIPVDGVVTWTYVVTNTGGTTLFDVALVDDMGVTISCPGGLPIPLMLPGDTVTCTGTGTAVVGQYENNVTTVGIPVIPDFETCGCDPSDPKTWPTDPSVYPPLPDVDPVTDTDPSHYIAVPLPVISPPQPAVPQPTVPQPATPEPAALECNLTVAIVDVNAKQLPDAILVEADPRFNTAQAMYAVSEIQEVSGKLEAFGVSGGNPLLKTIPRYLSTYAGHNLGSLTFQSGMGLDMELSPSMIAKMAADAGLKETPAIHPLKVPFEEGWPVHPDHDSLLWSTKDVETDLVPEALGQTLAAQSALLSELAASDNAEERFAASVMALQMRESAAFAADVLFKGDDGAYMPHRMRFGDDGITVVDASSRLADQAAMLRGLVKMNRAFKAAGIPQSTIVFDLMVKIWDAMETMHWNESLGIHETSYDPETDKRSGRVEVYTVQLAALALHELTADSAFGPQPAERLKRVLAFVRDKLVAEDGGVYAAYDVESGKIETDDGYALGDMAGALRILLLSDATVDADAANTVFAAMEKDLWDHDKGMYRDHTKWDYDAEYTPVSVATTMAALTAMADKIDAMGENASAILGKLSRFHDRVLYRSGLQREGNRLSPFMQADRLIVGDTQDVTYSREPVTIPSRLLADPVPETGLGKTEAPVLVKSIRMDLIPDDAEALLQLQDSDEFRLDREAPRTPLYLPPARLPKRSWRMSVDPETVQTATGLLYDAANVMKAQSVTTDNAFMTDPSILGPTADRIADLVGDYEPMPPEKFVEKHWPALAERYNWTGGEFSPDGPVTAEEVGLFAETAGRISAALPANHTEKEALKQASAAAARFIMEQMNAASGEVTGLYPATASSDARDAVEDGIGNQTAPILGLLRAYEQTGDAKFLDGALAVYRAISEKRWDHALGIFLSREDRMHLSDTDTLRYQYTDLDIAATLYALSELLRYTDGDLKHRIAENAVQFAVHLLPEPAGVSDGEVTGVDVLLGGRNKVYPGDTLGITIVVKNTDEEGNPLGALADLSVTNYLPGGFAYVPRSGRLNRVESIAPEISGTELRFNVDKTDDDGNITIEFNAKMSRNVQAAELKNKIVANGRTKEGGEGLCKPAFGEDVFNVGAKGGIKGKVFTDIDGNGAMGPGEKGLDGIRVLLDGNRDAFTDHTGAWNFDDLIPGEYEIRVDIATVPAGMRTTNDLLLIFPLKEGKTFVHHFGVESFTQLSE